MDGHDQRDHRAGDGLNCPDCRLEMQDYLDGTLEKKRSLSVFLHLRECEACRFEHDALRAVFAGLEALPALEAPADFDARVLASVPYGAYQAMASLRRERVPVFLEEQFLPAWLRARELDAAGNLPRAHFRRDAGHDTRLRRAVQRDGGFHARLDVAGIHVGNLELDFEG